MARQVQNQRKCSQRQVCRFFGLNRSSYRYQAQFPSGYQERIDQAVVDLSRAHPEVGADKIGSLVRKTHLRVSNQRVKGVRREEGLCVLRRDDGAVIYLNGQEILRENMPEGPVSAKTLATGPQQNEDAWPFEVSQHLQPGTNLLAVEIHQVNASSSDLRFDLELRPGTLGLSYFWSFSPEQFQAEIQDFLSRVPPTLQGDWTNRFEFAYTANPASAPKSIQGNWRNWEVRAQLQADLTHTAEARQAYETCLELLRAQPTSEAIARRIETVRQGLERLPK